jgi:MFS transporter, UMF1 family
MTPNASEQRGWYMYDFAQSAFSSTVVTLFLGPYLTSIAKTAADANGMIHPLGIPIDARSYWSFLVSVSVILQVLILPLVGAVADYGRRKKQVLAALAYTGVLTTIAMFSLTGDRYLLGGALFLVANVAFGAGVVVYNSFLPEIAPQTDRDAVSSKGWAIGYIGGGTLLALNLLLYLNAAKLGLSEGMAVRLSIASAGVWWGAFTLIPLAKLRNRGAQHELPPGERAVVAMVKLLRHTLGEMRGYRQALLFMIAFLLYNDAIQTVVTLASQFGNDELKIPVSQLTLAILMVQFVGIFGALSFKWLASRIAAKRAIVVGLVIWTAVLVYVYVSVKTTAQFFVMAGVVGIVLGGTQALSRSLFAQLIPKSKEAQYYSIYEVSDKGTSWLCPLFFGLALQFTKSYRIAIVSLVIFFIAGLLVLTRVDVERGESDVARKAGAA